MRLRHAHALQLSVALPGVPTLPVLLVLPALLVLGCDQVGAPLVDQQPVEMRAPSPGVMCSPAPECVPPEPVERLLVLAKRMDLTRCRSTDVAAPSCMPRVDPASPQVAAGDGDPLTAGDAGIGRAGGADAGGVGGDAGMSAGDVDQSDMQLPPCGDVVALVPQQLHCQDLISSNASAPDPEPPISAASWRQANVSLDSALPRTIVLVRPKLDQVFVELRGPITLRIERARDVMGLRVAGSASAYGAPRVELDEVSASELSIGDEQRPFEGEIDVRSSRLEGLQLNGRQLSLESTELERGKLVGNVLLASDVELDDIEVAAERATFSVAKLRDSQITRCRELGFVDAQLSETDVVACSGTPVRFYDSQVIAGALDGSVESDQSSFVRVRFGTRSTTELHVWRGGFGASSFCDHVQQLTLGGSPSISCSFCVSPTFVSDAVCALPMSRPGFELNVCPGLQRSAAIEACAEPLPEQHRRLKE